VNEIEALRILSEAGVDALALGHFSVVGICSFDNPRPEALTFWKSSEVPCDRDLNSLPHSTAVVTLPMHGDLFRARGISGIASTQPRVAFAVLARCLVSTEAKSGVHPGASVSTRASVDPTAWIGSGTVVGHASIGSWTQIGSNCVIHDGVSIGAGVDISDSTVIGVQGSGYVRLPSGSAVRIPHIGGVVIQDGVHIGAHVTIDSGTIDATVLASECRIGSTVHVAHNCRIGPRAMVLPGAVLCGGVVIGADAWVAPQATIREHVRVGERAVVGLGSVVWKDVADDTTVMGGVARRLPPSSPGD